jgi:hypothetical protein
MLAARAADPRLRHGLDFLSTPLFRIIVVNAAAYLQYRSECCPSE